MYVDAGVSIPVDGGGLLTSWFNLDLQPRIAENGEDVVFGPDHTSSNGTADGSSAGKDDYPSLDSGARSVTASAVTSVQSVQRRQKLSAPRVHMFPHGLVRLPVRPRMWL